MAASLRPICVAACACALAGGASPASAATEIERIAGTGDPVPGRAHLGVVFNGRARQANDRAGVLSEPVINNRSEVAFFARSSQPSDFNRDAALGLYFKKPGQPLQVLVDTGVTGGVPDHAVPGRAADARFGEFRPPLLNDRGDVVFWASWSSPSEGSGQGFYAGSLDGGPLRRIVDSRDVVPGFPGETFNGGFSFSGSFERFNLASLNDAGEVVFMGRFQRAGAPFESQGLYGARVDAGGLVRLVDTTNTVAPAGETRTFQGLTQSNQPALSNDGVVLFTGGIGTGTGPSYTPGVFAVRADGSAPPEVLALRFHAATLLDGSARNLSSIFNGHDIAAGGRFVFTHAFGNGAADPHALITGVLGTPGLTVVADSTGAQDIAGLPGSRVDDLYSVVLNARGDLGLFAQIALAGGASAQSNLTLREDGTALRRVAAGTEVPPGRAAPAVFSSFDFAAPALNAHGNLLLAPTGSDGAGDAVMGLWFYDVCEGELVRIADDETAPLPLPEGLDGTFAAPGCAGFPCERFVKIHDGHEARAGQYRSLNDRNEAAFLVAFSTFDVGVYVARVDTTCTPADDEAAVPAGGAAGHLVLALLLAGGGGVLVSRRRRVAAG